MAVQEHVVLDAPETRRYLEDLVRVWLGIDDRRIDVPRLPSNLARLLLRLEEYEDGGRDPWGCWSFAASENFQRGTLFEPEVDLWLRERRNELSRSHRLVPLWPHGRRFAVCLTHDVDLMSLQLTPGQALRYARAGLAPGIPGVGQGLLRVIRPPVRLARSVRSGIVRAPSLRDTLERPVALEAERGAAASYFFTVPPPGPRSRYDCVYAPTDRCLFREKRMRVADLMRTLVDEGFDVGLHGGYAAALTPGVLTAEREILEAATGLEVTTTRQHFLRWDIHQTPLYEEEAGLLADSSLGFNSTVGFRAGTSMPFHHFSVARRQQLRLLEVPLIAQDGALLEQHGLRLDLEGARALLRRLFDAVAGVGGVMTLLFHPDKLVYPDWLALYEWSLDHALENDAWLTSLHDLERWWRLREAAILGD